MRDDDALRELFAPLREPEPVDDGRVQDVLAAAALPTGPARRRPRRRRLMLVGISGAIAVVASTITITAVDQGHPGTFLGQAGARELLTAAADATRADPAPTGWRWLQKVLVVRRTLEGRPCPECAVERGVVEDETVVDLWSGPRGESYVTSAARPPRAIENPDLLQVAGVLEDRSGATDEGVHFLPLTKQTSSIEVDASFGEDTMQLDPQVVPETPKALLRWVRARLERRDRAWAVQKQGTRSYMTSSYTRATEVSSALIELATSLQLSGRQQAAAFEALAETPGATVVDLPPELSAPDRVGVQISAEFEDKAIRFPVENRVIVFDRASHRVVAEQRRTRNDEPQFTMPFTNGMGQRFRWLVDAGTGSETRYSRVADVPGPGLDAAGVQLFDVSGAQVLQRGKRRAPAGRSVRSPN